MLDRIIRSKVRSKIAEFFFIIFVWVSGTRFEHVFFMEDVDRGFVTLPEIQVEEADHGPAFGRLVQIQAPPDLDHPAGAQSKKN